MIAFCEHETKLGARIHGWLARLNDFFYRRAWNRALEINVDVPGGLQRFLREHKKLENWDAWARDHGLRS